VSAVEVELAKVASPPYTAVMEWFPVESPDVVKAATPAPFRAAVPNRDDPSRKATDPVGVPDDDTPTTVAVKVAGELDFDGLGLDVRDVVVPRGVTVWVRAAEVDPAKVTSPR
jgi:hypothetical protein